MPCVSGSAYPEIARRGDKKPRMEGDPVWWRTLARLIGAIFLACAMPVTLLLSSFVRIEGAGDLETVVGNDVAIGIAWAVGLFLIGFPPPGRTITRWLAVLAIVAMIVGGVVGYGLIQSHYEQYRIRSELS